MEDFILPIDIRMSLSISTFISFNAAYGLTAPK